MSGLLAVLKKELIGYFATPVAYIFIAIFLMISTTFTFYISNLYERGLADLLPFFEWHPWLFMVLIPAITMRLWAEERKTGTLELLITLPISLWHMVLGKFLAAWIFTIITLIASTPLWITVSWLGDPDHGIIAASYLGSMLMAGGYLALGACLSALTQNQVVAFVVSVVACFLFTVSGFPLVLGFFQGWLPQILVNTIASFSFLSNFSEIIKGVLELKSITFFLSFILLWLYFNTLALKSSKGA